MYARPNYTKGSVKTTENCAWASYSKGYRGWKARGLELETNLEKGLIF